MNSYNIGEAAENLEKSGLFLHKVGKENDDSKIFYRINQPSEDNLMYLYFLLLEKFNFVGFKDHLTKYILLMDSILMEEKNTIEPRIIIRQLLSLMEYFIMNFKVLFLESIKKNLSKSFDLEM